MNYYIECLTQKYLCFSGRARRKEYWLFVLFNYIVGVVIGFVCGFLSGATGIAALAYLGVIYHLAVLLPGLGVCVRRLHDIGKSGWWFLIVFVPFVGAIVLIVFLCLDSQPGENKYGANPKGL